MMQFEPSKVEVLKQRIQSEFLATMQLSHFRIKVAITIMASNMIMLRKLCNKHDEGSPFQVNAMLSDCFSLFPCLYVCMFVCLIASRPTTITKPTYHM